MTGVALDRGWKEQLRRVSELALLGIVACLLALPVVTLGAVVATLSSAVAHWIDNDDLPPWSSMGAELLRRLLPGIVPSVVAVLAGLVATLQLHWLASGVVPGGGIGIAAVLVTSGALLGVVLLAVPQLAGGRSWRSALAGGWAAFLQAPAAAAAALGVTGVAVVLGALLPGVALVLPAMLVLALHGVHRALVLRRA